MRDSLKDRKQIVAETMNDSVSSSVSRLTRYETSCLALSMLSSSASLTSIAVCKSILTENDEDNNTENITNNSIPFIEQIE